MDDIRIKDIRAFVETVANGGLAEAARYLGVNKSTISRSITRLEKSLGKRLIVRVTYPIELTKEGKIARPFMVEIDERFRNVLYDMETALYG